MSIRFKYKLQDQNPECNVTTMQVQQILIEIGKVNSKEHAYTNSWHILKR